MSSRLPTKRSSRSASLSAVPSNLARASPRRSGRVAPEARQRADDRGERRAQVVRHRGEHGRAQPLALRAAAAPGRCRRPAPRARSRRRSGCRPPRAGGAPAPASPPPPCDSTPITPIDERLVRIGMNSQRPPGRVSVPRPVGRSASHDQRAAARSASRELAVRREGRAQHELAGLGRRLLRHQDGDLGPHQPREMRHHDPQQVVEIDDAGDLAAEAVKLGRGARLAPRRLGLGAGARAERARHHRHEHEEEQRQHVRGIGDGELVERRQEEEVEAQDREGRDPERRAPAHAAPPPPSPARRRPARCWAGR